MGNRSVGYRLSRLEHGKSIQIDQMNWFESTICSSKIPTFWDHPITTRPGIALHSTYWPRIIEHYWLKKHPLKPPLTFESTSACVEFLFIQNGVISHDGKWIDVLTIAFVLFKSTAFGETALDSMETMDSSLFITRTCPASPSQMIFTGPALGQAKSSSILTASSSPNAIWGAIQQQKFRLEFWPHK